ncbi:hypothetical protein ACWDR0_09095 [Streptomyces sp. NPDC003691]
MSDSGKPDNPVPPAGTRTTTEAVTETKQVSSGLLDLIKVKGDASETGVRITECGDGKDPETYFQTLHPWSFYPATPAELAGVMERLRAELPANGWKVVGYERDSSRNRNLSLTADNDGLKFGVTIVHMAENDRPKLAVRVLSGCYRVPDGERVDSY